MEKNLPKILTVNNPREEKILRRKTSAFDFSSASPKEINKLVQTMRRTMKAASNGIGLSANQIGLDLQLFIAEIPDESRKNFFAVFNPKIVSKSKETVMLAEGCLSVPGTYGEVERYKTITVKYSDKNQKEITAEVSGLLAHIFQHEIDHLNGILFIDKARTYTEDISSAL